MKRLFPELFYRFQIRLLFYLLLVGSIPLLVAVYVFYEQSLAYSGKELQAYVGQMHQQTLTGVQKELLAVSTLAQDIAADYAVQKAAKLPMFPKKTEEEAALKAYLDAYLYRQTQQHKYVLQICVSLTEANRVLCSQGAELLEAIDAIPGARVSGFEAVAAENKNAKGYTLKYGRVLQDSATRTELGFVTIWINLSLLMSDAQALQPPLSHTLTDPQGNILYQWGPFDKDGISGEGAEKTAAGSTAGAGSLRSSAALDVVESEWRSYYQLPKAAAFSSIPDLRQVLIVLFAVLIVLSVGSSILFSRYVTRPLHTLKGLMKRAELGDLRAYWTPRGKDEWNDLGESYNQMLNRVEELIKQVKLEESLKKEAEMEALHYQLNPHFLYNTLNTIKWVAKIHKTPQISEVVSALVRLLQASLGKKGEFITLREEQSLIQDYMDIQSFRYGERVRLRFELDEMTLGCYVPRMLLQPLVENAVIHGIEPAKREGVITIRSWLDRDLLFCQVEDNGVGMPESELRSAAQAPDKSGQGSVRALRERMSGIGISHIREKIKLYYGAEYKMHISSKVGEGTTIRMSLPIHRNEE